MWRCERVGETHCWLQLPDVPTKLRPRSRRTGGGLTVYEHPRTREFERAIREAWVDQVGDGMAGFSDEVRVEVCVHRPLAKSNPKYWLGRPDLMKPDADNIAKVVLDALNGVAFADDAQVTELSSRKCPRTRNGKPVELSIYINYYENEYIKE